jgi:hypothetical protein
VGLARRRDPSALPVVRSALEAEGVFRLAVESARYLADPRLLPSLAALRSWWDVDPPLLEAATAACDPEVRAREATLLADLWTGLASADAQRSLRATCPLLETYVVVEFTTVDGEQREWHLDALARRLADEDIDDVIAAMISG